MLFISQAYFWRLFCFWLTQPRGLETGAWKTDWWNVTDCL